MPTYHTIPDVMASYHDRFLPDKAADVDGIVQLEFTGEGGAVYHLIIKHQQLHIVEGAHDAPTLTISTTAENWLKVNNGETTPMALMMEGQLAVKGSLPLALEFQAVFQSASTS